MKAYTEAQLAALSAGHVRPVLFVELALDTPVRLCSAREALPWNGYTWKSAAPVGFLTPISESLDLEAQGIKVGMAGISPSVLSMAEGTPMQGKMARVWVGLYGDDYKLIGDPVEEYSGRIDVPTTKEGAPDEQGVISCAISIAIESRYARWLRPNLRRRTDADQQRAYPGDTCMEFVGRMSNVTLSKWGRK